jgi:hypothetical protein
MSLSTLAIEVGYGAAFSAAETSPDRAGFGVRGGVELASGVWLGASLTSHVGSSIAANGPGNSYAFRAWDTYLGPEVGYTLHFGPLRVQPTLAVGLLSAHERTDVRGATASSDRVHVYVAPGVLAGATWRGWIAGVDARVPILSARDFGDWALGLFGVVGRSFETTR